GRGGRRGAQGRGLKKCTTRDHGGDFTERAIALPLLSFHLRASTHHAITALLHPLHMLFSEAALVLVNVLLHQITNARMVQMTQPMESVALRAGIRNGENLLKRVKHGFNQGGCLRIEPRDIRFFKLALMRPESSDNDVPPHIKALLQRLSIIGGNVVCKQGGHGTNARGAFFQWDGQVPQNVQQRESRAEHGPYAMADLGWRILAGCCRKFQEQCCQVLDEQRTGNGDISQSVARVSVPELLAFRVIEKELHKLIKGEPCKVEISRLVHASLGPLT